MIGKPSVEALIGSSALCGLMKNIGRRAISRQRTSEALEEYFHSLEMSNKFSDDYTDFEP